MVSKLLTSSNDDEKQAYQALVKLKEEYAKAKQMLGIVRISNLRLTISHAYAPRSSGKPVGIGHPPASGKKLMEPHPQTCNL